VFLLGCLMATERQAELEGICDVRILKKETVTRDDHLYTGDNVSSVSRRLSASGNADGVKVGKPRQSPK